MALLKRITTISLLLFSVTLAAQTVTIEGFVFETDNRGYIRNTTVSLLKKASNELVAETKTDKNGKFSLEVPAEMDLQLVAGKKHFFPKDQLVSTKGVKADEKVFVKIELERKPGYVFDVTVADGGDKTEAVVDAIQGARIEIFNNTTGVGEMDLKNYPHPNFKFTFEKGNHYTIMIRKKGFINKRIEAYIDVEGCILCFDGLGIVEPGVTDVLSNENSIGTFLANIDLEPAEINKTFTIENIYYDYNKFDIREDAAAELDKLFGVLNDNPQLIIEMGSHTDARGKDQYNLSLSEKRAKAAFNYLIEYGNIDPARLTWRGYGESSLVNKCGNGVNCSEDNHQLNRRTELKIVGIQEDNSIATKSLKDILVEERLMKEVNESEVIEVKANKEKTDTSENNNK